MTTRRTLLVFLAFLAVLASACGSSNSAEPASTSSGAAPTTTEPPATTAPNQCPGNGALPEGVEAPTLANADVDGDGDIDTVHAYRLDGEWKLQVSIMGGGGTTLAVANPHVGFVK